MWSTDIAVVVVLMVLRTAAYPGSTTETPTGSIGTTTPRVCPDLSSCILYDNCRTDERIIEDGCPTCWFMSRCHPEQKCVESHEDPTGYACVSAFEPTNAPTRPPPPICTFVTCSPGEQCVPNYECPQGKCYSCVQETTTETTTETTIGRNTTDIRRCPFCDGNCILDYSAKSIDGCPVCHCFPHCGFKVICDILPEAICIRDGDDFACGTMDDLCPRPPPCAYFTRCGEYIGVDGCRHCECQICEDSPCAARNETCVVQHDTCRTWESRYPCYPTRICVSTTEPAPTAAPFPNCKSVNCPQGKKCVPDYRCSFPGCYSCISPYGPTPAPTAVPTDAPTAAQTPLPICTFVTCPPGEQCVPNYECPDGKCYSCVQETTTETTTETTIGRPTPRVCPSCDGDCQLDFWVRNIDGCYSCYCFPNCGPGLICNPEQTCERYNDIFTCFPIMEPTNAPTRPPPPICTFVTCPPGEQCIPNYECPEGKCYSCVSIYETSFPTTPQCPAVDCIMIGCRAVPGPDECLTCDCSTDMCYDWPCGPDEICVLKAVVECQYPDWCYREPTCVPLQVTTTPFTTTRQTTTSLCPPLPSDILFLGCGTVFDQDGCLTLKCYTCDEVCGVGQECQLQRCYDDPCSLPAICLSTTTTTTETTTGTPPSTACPTIIWCEEPHCSLDYSSGECPTCLCFGDPICMLSPCGPDEECVPNVENPSEYTCVSIHATTTPCPMIECAPYCVSDTGSDGCPTCACPPSCQGFNCSDGYECQLVDVFCKFVGPCFPEPQCVPIQETTTSCPTIECGPDCVSDTGSDGCLTCACPPSCQTVKCSAGYECQLVNVTCFRYPCFPQPQCVPTENPCKGTPNLRRCGRFRNRWTYNSVTNKCEKFRHYGCTPSLNTFLSPKACKNKCTGGAQSICEDVVCEKNCYTYTRKNKCPKCICPNPCEGFRCREGYECKLRDAKCEDKDPKPFCARK